MNQDILILTVIQTDSLVEYLSDSLQLD